MGEIVAPRDMTNMGSPLPEEAALPGGAGHLVDVGSSVPQKPVVTNSSREEAAFLVHLREGVIGSRARIATPFGTRPLRYFDFMASGRFHRQVEDELNERVLPFMANTHTESNETGRQMSRYYERAFERIAAYLHASQDDVLLPVGAGSTAAINRLIQVLGLRIPDQLERWRTVGPVSSQARSPVVFRSMMEHHSNDIAWRETIAETVYVDFDREGRISLEDLDAKLRLYADRPLKIGTFSAASNVTGILNDVRGLARVLHEHGAWAFFDYAAAGPYVDIDMHPEEDPKASLDAVFLSVHKFLGGPRCPGLLAANRNLFANRVPAEPGGGTVLYTSPWDHRYLSAIEQRETGGTPPIVQSIQAGLAFDLKAAIGTERIERIEHDYLRRALKAWANLPGVMLLGNTQSARLSVVSLVFERLHHNLAATLLNDLFGVQARAGCMCAGPYGHLLLDIDEGHSARIRARLDGGHIGEKPGWVRVSFSPVVTEDDFQALLEAVEHIARHGRAYEDEYQLSDETGAWLHKRTAQIGRHPPLSD